jgi:toxin ParE1/3/4
VKPIGFHREAEAELDAAVAYYERQREGLGLDLQAEVEKSTHRIQTNPRACGLYKDTGFRKCVIRRFPFTIFYQELDDRIWIAAVAHQKRKPDYWLRRDPEDGSS